jgi:predicted transcriptional regulator
MTIKDKCVNPMVEIDMEEGTLILVHLESIIAIVPNLIVVIADLKVDVKVEETKAIVMEE